MCSDDRVRQTCMNNIAFRMEEVKSRKHLFDDLFHRPHWQPALLILCNLESEVVPEDFIDHTDVLLSVANMLKMI